ncbi:MAG: DinB family protein [Bacteroidetes bacterium]|nr:DinB family protein [Bacteroidota bacterium]
MKYVSQLVKQKELVSKFFDNTEIYQGKYREGGWTGKEVLLHIKDAETVSYDRIRRIISEENPILWYFEEDRWQKNLNYMAQDIDLAKKLFILTRESIIETVKMHLKKSGTRKGIHSRRGSMTMEELVQFLIWHTDHHIKHLKKIKPAA